MKNSNKLLLVALLTGSLLVSCSRASIDESILSNEDNLSISEESSSIRVKEGEVGFNLPLLVIDTNGEKINGVAKIDATLKVYDNVSGVNFLSDDPTLVSNIGIKIRGNTTRRFPKKQYSIEFVDSNGDDVDKKLLDMPKESDWILNGPFADKSLIRNYMVYSVSRKIMEYAPRVRMCEVVLVDDGKEGLEKTHYKGVYVLIEKIKQGKDRVNISNVKTSGEETSFIVAKNPARETDIFLGNYGYEIGIYDYELIVEYPSKNINEEKIEYITKTISNFERILYSDKYDDPQEGYTKYIDVESFVDYYIINEFFRNTDAGILSTYVYKSYGEKIKAGPVWDFNTSMGNSNTITNYNDSTGFYMAQTSWFDRLMKDKNFVSKVIKRYRLLRETYLSDDYLLDFIDETVKMLGDAPKRNFEVWPIYMCNQISMFKDVRYDFTPYEHDTKMLDEYIQSNQHILRPTDGMATSYKEEIEMLKEFIVKRGKWIDKNIESLYKWTD